MVILSVYIRALFFCSMLASCGLMTPVVVEEAEELGEEAVVEFVEYEIEKHEQKK
jgi:hypothetical protein